MNVIKKVPMMGDIQPTTGLPYEGKDEAIKKFISSVSPDARLVFSHSEDVEYPSLIHDPVIAIGYICDIDYERNEATIMLYDDMYSELTDNSKLAFAMIGNITETSVVIDRIVRAYLK